MSPARRTLLLLCSLAVPLAPAALAAGTQAELPSRRYHYDRPLPLVPLLDRLALRAPPRGSAALEELAADPRLARVEDLEVAGWRWLHLARPAADAGELAALLGELAAPGLFPSPVYDVGGGHWLVPGDRLLVRFHPTLAAHHAQALLEPYGAIEARDWAGLPRAYALRPALPHGAALLALANRLSRDPAVRFAEPDWFGSGEGLDVGECELVPDDPSFPVQWHLANTQAGGQPDFDVDATEAWVGERGDPSILVMVFETGCEMDHPDLNMGPGKDFTGKNAGGNPVYGGECHGTAVAGCIAAHVDNALGVASVAPGARVASARTFESNAATCASFWNAQFSWSVDALVWAEQIGVRVTSNSNNYGSPFAPLADKYEQTRAAGMVHFAAAGNGAHLGMDWPARYGAVMAIGASRRDGARASFSNWGSGLAWLAPGEAIMTTDRVGTEGYSPAGDVAVVSGTSFSSPISAASAALLLSVDPGLDAIAVEGTLYAGCVDMGPPGYDFDFGAGHLNSAAALLLVGGLPDHDGDGVADGCERVGVSYCTAVPNSSGLPGSVSALGSEQVALNDLTLVSLDLPPQQFGYHLVSATQGFVANPGGSQGNLCLGGTIGRYAEQAAGTGPDGVLVLQVDLGALPPPIGGGVQPGETWSFQAWFRDQNPGATSNFTDGVAVSFL